MVKKQLIMEKSLELFAKQGFEATSVQQITDHCGISKGAFYLSFKSKDELILALIDHFMMQLTSDIDHMVKNTDTETLLYSFYYKMYHSFTQHTDFAKVLIKEQIHSFNEELLSKIKYYDQLMDQSILLMIERLYDQLSGNTKYDLIFSIKGFLRTYSDLFFYHQEHLDLNELAQSLVEKTNILAKYVSHPFITKDLMEMFHFSMKEKVEKEQIVEMLEGKMSEMEDSIEKESLMLLRSELLDPTLPRAVIKGLLENIQQHPHCKWVAYLVREHLGF